MLENRYGIFLSVHVRNAQRRVILEEEIDIIDELTKLAELEQCQSGARSPMILKRGQSSFPHSAGLQQYCATGRDANADVAGNIQNDR